ncbi:MAG: 6,7-dimethyl-8-ribityllumazine synthase [Candidatus Dactylopiibacterium carminicum]|uniref:6,7-dimethyl-8-ribityllumazine synthase n=1 Tax=Candidatus Dactylopiibacterium carminicum TaxID=857335 RepID=A0A272EYT9_9RHOO|nr:6,7-dimethyl-8-ribityllumazine synthase [Candidatus Dactylopiibacterium carminicum]KAF7600795.1 6,7-dimethyl-8-ribityllumazine synthase [Candidatus Dactylopiibacterium carminicum]PAS95294.1 MAG: 6,7-dimethyl-8-ribityllumazine synthase [Candidatus Dactylopiibacterium carminicum]PAS98694.1 MAG: 6,7-dimethyl-8-ribityllumazine synthase [Candidatus Dactylopiibacterium carminicum]PAT00802.1 MAG: 6,7-dimethyl-8-ribityllumazine synthase [Candidatus Dactylopiibacterium carminicum]
MSRFENIIEIHQDLRGKDLRIAIVVGRFNAVVGEGLLGASIAELLKREVAPENILVAKVPGALEMPLTLRTLAESGRYDALIALGAVIRGDTYHFEVVSNEMASGITRVQLDTGVPIANGVLTTNTDEQAEVRMGVKGRECAECAIEMANLLRTLRA